MKKFLLLIFLVTLASGLSAQNSYLYVQQPQTLKGGNGTIENAVVAMAPNGSFMKYDVTMTFSARSVTAFTQNDSVEVNFQFALPAESVVYDLWLWVGKELSRGLILDRSIASSTYEGIVKRRRDPALLQKTSQNQYQLQIYPMAASGSRTVKFSFNAPLKKTASQWYAAVPANLFRQSLVPVQSLRVIYYAPSQGHVPSVVNDTRYAFTPWTDSLTTIAAWKCDIPSDVFAAVDPAIGVPIAATDNVVFTQFAAASGGTFHVLVDPFAVLDVNTSRKFLVVFDYDSVKTTVLRSAYIEGVKSMLKANCTAKDSFAVIFNDWQRSGENWIAADSAGIANAFRTLGAAAIPNGSNIPGLFMNAVEFLNAHGRDGSILFVAASDKLGTPAAADPVIAWLRIKLPAGVGVHFVDVMNRNGYNYYLGNGGYSYGNRYFYDAVKNLTAGSYRTMNYPEDITAALGGAVQALRGGLSSLDLQVRYANGFTYSKYSYGIVPFQSVLSTQLVGQIGKYAGSGPISLELAGFYRGQPYQKSVPVSSALINTADSSLRATWVGKYIADIEWLNTTTDVVKSITDECIRERVVCRYTALLALEPGDTIVVPKNNIIRLTQAAATSSVPVSYAVAEAYPNPFNPSTTLRVRLPEGTSAQDASMKIYNVLGQLVKTFDPAGVMAGSYREFRWDAVDDAGRRVASGMYLFVVTTPNARYTVKLLLLK